MSSLFGSILAGVVETTVDRTFADEEGFDFRPVTQADGVNGRPVTDPDRAFVAEVPAIYDDRPRDLDESGRGRDRPGFADRMPQISVQTCRLPWTVVRGDEVTRRATGEVFRVTEIEPDGQTRVNLQVTLMQRGGRP